VRRDAPLRSAESRDQFTDGTPGLRCFQEQVQQAHPCGITEYLKKAGVEFGIARRELSDSFFARARNLLRLHKRRSRGSDLFHVLVPLFLLIIYVYPDVKIITRIRAICQEQEVWIFS
jgi:hypothetical protein